MPKKLKPPKGHRSYLLLWTVVGIYEDNGQAFVGHYAGGDAASAKHKAEKIGGSMRVISIFHGHLDDEMVKLEK